MLSPRVALLGWLVMSAIAPHLLSADAVAQEHPLPALDAVLVESQRIELTGVMLRQKLRTEKPGISVAMGLNGPDRASTRRNECLDCGSTAGTAGYPSAMLILRPILPQRFSIC